MENKTMIHPKKLEKLDQIVLSMSDINAIYDWFEQFKKEVDVSKLVLFPFLEEGVFVLKEITFIDKVKTDVQLYFKFNEGMFEIHLFLKKKSEYIPACGYEFPENGVYALFGENGGKVPVEVFFTDKRVDEDIIMTNVSSTLSNFAAYMLFVDWINKNPEYIVKEQKQVQLGHPTKKSNKGKSKKKNKAVINNKKTVYKLKLDDELEQNFKKEMKKFNERVISWTVRGHFRRYQNGKVVWVKPHVKGKGPLKEKDYSF